jgi:hypothetical protein
MKQSLLIIPEEFLNEIKAKQEKIIGLLENYNKDSEPIYLTEKEAKELLKKKSTWFWQMRRDGLLPYSKIGKSIFYSVKDLNSILEKGKINSSI